MTLDILLPYYGDPSLLKETVRSVQNQDDPDWQLTVVDDGYPDESVPKWFEGLNDERIHYRRNASNVGLPSIYTQCMDLVRHDLVVLAGADDVMLPNYVRTIRRLHENHPEAGIIQPGVELIDGDGNPYRNLLDETKQRLFSPTVNGTRIMSGEMLATSLLRGNWLYFPSLAFRSDELRKVEFRDGLNAIHDLALVIDLLLSGTRLLVDDTTCFQYRRHRASDSSSRAMDGTRFADQRNYFLGIAEELDAHGWPRAARAARNHISSRLHALTVLPQAVRHKHRSGIQNLVRHAFTPSKRTSR